MFVWVDLAVVGCVFLEWVVIGGVYNGMSEGVEELSADVPYLLLLKSGKHEGDMFNFLEVSKV